jgi:acetyl esterase/lipase
MARDSRSVLTRKAPPPDATVAYGEHPDQILDIRQPTGPSRGLVVFLHGGFWRHEYDRVHTGPLTTALAAAGFAVVTPEYRRTGAPGGGWPGTFDDVAAAVRAATTAASHVAGAHNASAHKAGAPEEATVILAGHSAGGHLALWAAAGLARDGVPTAGVVALAPVADLREAYRLDLDGGAVVALLGGGPDEFPDRYAVSDPFALLPLGVRQVLCHGGLDRQVPPAFSRRFADSARAAGDVVDLLEWPEADHFDLIDPESPFWPDLISAFALLAPPNPRPLR